ncbi:MAG: bifunctional oligoribonuclease/PAP phosphatase NrnA [Clostridia bacterium]|nr:bifunctional oligoribonuclease/PAP phosphatase NrnA [Clostridia bacterium]
MFEKILDNIKRYDKIIIHRHEKPDGDAIGSQVGMKQLIIDNFPHKKVFAVGDSPRFLSFIEGAEPDLISDDEYDGALAVILDCGSSCLISDGRFKLASSSVRIDHHIFCEKIADVEVVDTSFESCCGMVTEFALESGLRINPVAAKSLFTGLVTDSGRFRYDSTNARSLRLAAALLEIGVDTNVLYKNLYADTYESKLLRASFTLKIKLTEANTAYIYTTKEELEELGADAFVVSRSMVGVMSDMKGVGIWVNFTECEDGVLCELRSDRLNINPIAVKYGGGGHAKASGAKLRDYNEAMAMLGDLDRLSQESNII